MTTDIVILNWNGKELLRKYLPSVIRSVQGLSGVSVTVADNASTDGSEELLSSEFPEVKFIALDKNYGFAEGYNRALKTLDADCFLLLNSDVEVPEDWFHPLQEWMQLHDDCGICGPKLHQTSDRERFEYAGAAGGYIDRLGFPFCRGRVMDMTEIDEGQYDVPAEVMWVSGAALMIRSSLFRELGGFNSEFFAHMEEIDLCWKARLKGWKVNVVPRSTVFHQGGASLPQKSPVKLFLNYRNNLKMMASCLPETLTVSYAFNVLAENADMEEGPDMFGCCCDCYGEMDRKTMKKFNETVAMLAISKTNAIIHRRMIVDNLCSAAYLLRGQFSYFAAVRKAHREFKATRTHADRRKLKKYLDNILSGERLDIARNLISPDALEDNYLNATFGLKGIWGRSILWQALLKKETIFAKIKERLI